MLGTGWQEKCRNPGRLDPLLCWLSADLLQLRLCFFLGKSGSPSPHGRNCRLSRLCIRRFAAVRRWSWPPLDPQIFRKRTPLILCGVKFWRVLIAWLTLAPNWTFWKWVGEAAKSHLTHIMPCSPTPTPTLTLTPKLGRFRTPFQVVTMQPFLVSTSELVAYWSNGDMGWYDN